MASYRIRNGDILDAVESELEAKPGLAELGPAIPADTLVTLPNLPCPLETIPTVKLWD